MTVAHKTAGELLREAKGKLVLLARERDVEEAISLIEQATDLIHD